MKISRQGSAVALLVIATLCACGGGGTGTTEVPVSAGGGASAAPPNGSGGGAAEVLAPAPSDVVSQAGTLQTTVAEGAYSDPMSQGAFDALNTLRSGAGAGLVAQSLLLDAAAWAHAKYLTTNLTIAHTEDPAKPAFYAASPSDRLARAGFASGYSTEVIAAGPSMAGAACVFELLNSVYHAAALLSQSTHVGFGFGVNASGVPTCVADLATAATDFYGQVAPSGALVAYPHSGQLSVFETFYVDHESPRPPVALFPNQTAGTPVVVSVRNADFLNLAAAGTLLPTITQFALKDQSGNIVPSAILANSAFVAGVGVSLNADARLPAGAIVLVPLAPLSNGAAYTVVFSVSLSAGGPALTKAWTFSTMN